MLRRGWLVSLVFVFVAALLASRWLSYDLLFVDEWWSIFKSGGDIYGPLSPASIWDRIVTIDPGGMGAGYYLALGAWEAFVGSTPFAVRLFSLLIGLLAIAMTYRIGADWFSRRVGLYAAALIASSAFFVNFMHEARAYTLVALLACCVIYAYWRVMTISRPGLWHYAALTLALAGLAYSHYVALSVAAVIGFFHLLFVRKDRRWQYAVASMMIGAILYLPWIGVMLDVIRRGADDVNRQANSMVAGQAVSEVAGAFSNGSPALLLLFLFAALLLLNPIKITFSRPATPTVPQKSAPPPAITMKKSLGLIAPPAVRRVPVEMLLWLWLLVGLCAALLVNAAVPFLVHLRYLIFLWPALALIAALGVEAVARRGAPSWLLVGVWFGFGVINSMSPDFMRAQFGEIDRVPAAGVNAATGVLEAVIRDDDLVLYHIQQPGFTPFGLFIEDYLSRRMPETVEHAQTELMNNSFAETDAEYREDVQMILAEHERVWILDVPELDESQRTRTLTDTLAESYVDCGTALDRTDAILRLYARRPDARIFRQNAPYSFGDETTGLARMQEIPGRSAPDAPIHVTLGWLSNGPLRSGTHSVAVHIVNASGVVIAQDDYPLPSRGYGCHLSLFPDLPPEVEYSIYVTVYNPQTLEPLAVNGVPDGRIRLR